MEGLIINAVKEEDLTKLSMYLHKFDQTLDSYKDSQGNTLLMISTQLGNKNIVELLLQHGADPNIQNVRSCPSSYRILAMFHYTIH